MHQLLGQMPLALREIIGPIQTVDVPEQGATSDVAVLSGSNGRFVVKRAKRPPYLEWLRREYQVLRSLSPGIDFIPKPFCYAEGNHKGSRSHWLLMEHLPGVSLREVLRQGVDSAERRRLLFAFGRALLSIHSQPVPNELASQEPWLDHMLQLAESYLHDYEVDGDAALLDRLRAGRPGPLPSCLIHGDYTLDNVLICDGQVSGVVDWCWGAFGDPRHDLAIATRCKPEAFHDPADFDAFYDGYAGRRITEDERAYFLGLYEFF